jgi:type II secretory pathway component PulF
MMNGLVGRIFFRMQIWMFQSSLDKFLGELLQQLDIGVLLGKFMRSRSAAAKARKSMFAPVYSIMATRFSDGKSFSEACEGILPALNILMIASGEKVDRVRQGVETARFLNRSMKKVQGMIFGALWWPITLDFMAMGMVLFFGLAVVPEFTSMMPVSRLGTSYQMAYAVANFAREYGWFIAPVLISLAVFIPWSVFNLTGPVRRVLDVAIPPYNIYRLKKAGELMIIFSGFWRNGLQIDEVLTTVMARECPYIRWHLNIMRERVADGAPLVGGLDEDGHAIVGVLDTGLFPNAVIEELLSFANSDKLEVAMQRIGFENVDGMLAIVQANVSIMAKLFQWSASLVIGMLVYDTFTLSSKLSGLASSGQF